MSALPDPRRNGNWALDRGKYLDRQKRYNDSWKGKARRDKYEEKHPERKLRWEEARNAIRPRNGW